LVGIVSGGTLTINNTHVDGQLYADKSGGFVGEVDSGATLLINNCYSDLQLGNTANAGFVGITNGSTKINNSITLQKVDTPQDGTRSFTADDNNVTIGHNCSSVQGKEYVSGANNNGVNGNVSSLFGFDLTINGGESTPINAEKVGDILNKIREQLGEDYHVNLVDGKIQIVGPAAITSLNLTTGNGFTPSISSKLGFGGQISSTDTTVDIPVPENGWVVCTTVEEVKEALSPNIDENSPALLRELIGNAMAIICTYTPGETDSHGNQIYNETSVSVDTHLREVQNDADMAKAEANYEAALRKIDEKDKKYDKELAAIENERKAVTEQLDTFKKCIQDNIDRTFKVFNS